MLLNFNAGGGVRRTFAMYPEVLADIMLFNLSAEKLAEIKLMTLPELGAYVKHFLLTTMNCDIQASFTVTQRVFKDMYSEVQDYKFSPKK